MKTMKKLNTFQKNALTNKELKQVKGGGDSCPDEPNTLRDLWKKVKNVISG